MMLLLVLLLLLLHTDLGESFVLQPLIASNVRHHSTNILSRFKAVETTTNDDISLVVAATAINGSSSSLSSSNQQQQSQSQQSPRVQPRIARPPLPGMNPDYPFENVVFQGGGAKGTIYGGAAMALEELNVLPYLKRYAGASAGCFTALLLALGLDAKQLQTEMNDMDLVAFLYDGEIWPSRGGAGGTDAIPKIVNGIGFGKNLMESYGMHPGRNVTTTIGNILEKYTGNPDLTFRGLYENYGVELVICVSNLSRSMGEYCHVNLTPELPIKDAIRMSMSLPIITFPVTMSRLKNLPDEVFSNDSLRQHLAVESGNGDYYVDGGLYNNYPLEAFDGWWLSTSDGDDIISKFQQGMPWYLKLRAFRKLNRGMSKASVDDMIGLVKDTCNSSFEGPNPKTIGFRACDMNDPDNFDYYEGLALHVKNPEQDQHKSSDQQQEEDLIPLPDTPKARAYREQLKEDKDKNTDKLKKAFVAHMRWVLTTTTLVSERRKKYPRMAAPHGIPVPLLLELLETVPPHEDLKPEVFGLANWNEWVSALDLDKKGYVLRTDIGKFYERFGIRALELGNRTPRDFSNMSEYILQMITSLQTLHEERTLSNPQNLARTCVLDCKYVGTIDFDCLPEDKEYLYQIGRVEALRFVQNRAEQLKSGGGGKRFRLRRLRQKISKRLSKRARS